MKMTPDIRSRSTNIQNSLGTRTAAGYLRNQGVSLRLALFLLLGVKSERTMVQA
jgi:hypothetical protein